MDIKDFNNRVNEIDFKFIKYISDETKQYANKVLFLSFTMLLITFKIVVVEQFSFEGIDVKVEESYLIIVIFLVSIYYYLQFYFSIKIDSLLVKIPSEILLINDFISKEYLKITKSYEDLRNDYSESLNKETFYKSEFNDFLAKKDKIERSMNENEKVYSDWNLKFNKVLFYNKVNFWINRIFPTMCFLTSSLSFIVFILKKGI